MKRIFTLIVFFLSVGSITSQNNVLIYNFNGNVSELNGNGPDLIMTGSNGTFATDTLPELGNAVRQVYHFNQNSGLRFFNDSANNFLGATYSIEMYFRFDNLGSWKRVIDWKNRKSDGGAYFFNNQLNFYPIIYSGPAPVVPNEYTYYVVTRDSATKEVHIYADADVHATFVDNGSAALIDTSNILNFFQDDLVVQNEASAGAIAQLKIYNYRLSDTVITQNYTNLQSEIMGVPQNGLNRIGIKVFPNPANDVFTVRTNQKSIPDARIEVWSVSGQLIEQRAMGNDRLHSFSTSNYRPGVYIIRFISGQNTEVTRVVVN